MPKTIASAAGNPIVDNRKALLLICSRYSRFAINSVLRIGLASHGLDEDLLERRLNQFKSINGRHRGCLMQQLLRVPVVLEPNLGMAGEIVRLGNLGAV